MLSLYLVRELRSVVGHNRYYQKIIMNYAHITIGLEKLLKKETRYVWMQECQEVLDLLNYELVIDLPILD